jgi:hypothetical protein
MFQVHQQLSFLVTTPPLEAIYALVSELLKDYCEN